MKRTEVVVTVVKVVTAVKEVVKLLKAMITVMLKERKIYRW